jgi:hypothetical protein
MARGFLNSIKTKINLFFYYDVELKGAVTKNENMRKVVLSTHLYKHHLFGFNG